MNRNGFVRYAVILGVSLSGCSPSITPPTPDDIKNALQDSIDRFLGSGNNIIIDSVDKLSCEKSKDKTGFICDYTSTALNKKTNERNSRDSNAIRFAKGGNVWFMCPSNKTDQGACAAQKE